MDVATPAVIAAANSLIVLSQAACLHFKLSAEWYLNRVRAGFFCRRHAVVRSGISRLLQTCRHAGHDFVHHWVVAVTVGSIVGLLHHGGALAWLDAVMLRIAGAHAAQHAQNGPPDALAPEVLLIDGTVYERVFGRRSPLDRQKLAQIVGLLADVEGGLPETVVFDLDLSTDGGQPLDGDPVDQQLQRLVEAGVRVVLPLPAPAYTPEMATAQVAWIRKACSWWPKSENAHPNGRLVFASPSLRSHGGRVLQYSPHDYSLGIAATSAPAIADVCRRSHAELQMMVQVATASQMRNLTTPAPFPRMLPLNASFFQQLDAHVHAFDKTDALPTDAEGKPLALRGRTVFVGGSYDPRDRFETPLDPEAQTTEGVTLHAAVFYSAIKPVTVEQGMFAFGLDIVVGLAMGYLFTSLWRLQQRPHAGGGWSAYLLPKVEGTAILISALLIAVMLVWISGVWLLSLNFWVSPGPVVLGVCAKLMLSRGVHEHAQAVLHPSRWLHRGVLVALPVINVGVILSH